MTLLTHVFISWGPKRVLGKLEIMVSQVWRKWRHKFWLSQKVKTEGFSKYSVSHLIQTPRDHGNFFSLKGVLLKVIQNCGQFHNKSRWNRYQITIALRISLKWFITSWNKCEICIQHAWKPHNSFILQETHILFIKIEL